MPIFTIKRTCEFRSEVEADNIEEAIFLFKELGLYKKVEIAADAADCCTSWMPEKIEEQ